MKRYGLLDQLLVSGGNFLTMALCAHALPLAEQGKFTYVFASYLAVLLLNVSGIFQGAAVRAPSLDSGSYRATLARWQLVQAGFAAVGLAAGWYGLGRWVDWQASGAESLWLAAFLMLQQSADFDRRSAYIFADARRALSSSALIYPLRVVTLWWWSPHTLLEVLWLLSLSAILPSLLTVRLASRGALPNWWQETKAHLHYSRLFMLGAPLGWLWSYAPVFLLAMLHGKEQAALLASIRNIANLANVLMEQIETKASADWARLQHQQGSASLQHSVRNLIRLGIGFWAVVLLLIGWQGEMLVRLILGELYAAHWELLLVGWLSYGVYFMARIQGIKHRTLGANQIEFIGNLVGVICALSIGYAVITTNGIFGAAWLYVIICAAIWASQALALRKYS